MLLLTKLRRIYVCTDVYHQLEFSSSYAQLTYVVKWSNKRSLESVASKPTSERPSKAQKIAKEHSLPMKDVGGEAGEADFFQRPIVPWHSPTEVDNSLDLTAAEQEAFVKELRALLKNVEVTPPSPVNEQKVDERPSATIPPAKVNLEASPPHSRTKGSVSPAQNEHGLFQNLLNSDVLNEPSSSPNPQDTAPPQIPPTEADFSSSPLEPSHRSSLLQEEMQPPLTPTQTEPPREYEPTRHYETGNMFPTSYLSRVRHPVDSTFSNDHWGDAYYFSDPCTFKHTEDFRPDHYHRTDHHAVIRGLKERARTIPERSEEESWKSFDALLRKLGGEKIGRKDPAMALTEMKQRIQRRINETGILPGPRDLDPTVQEQTTYHSRRAMQGTNAAALIAPGTPPPRAEAASSVRKRLSGNERVVGKESDGNSESQQSLDVLQEYMNW